MPQQNLLRTDSTPWSLTLSYQEDPMAPDTPPRLTVTVRNQHRTVLLQKNYKLPPVWGPEAFASCAKVAIQAYDSAGEVAVDLAVRREAKSWVTAAEQMLSQR